MRVNKIGKRMVFAAAGFMLLAISALVYAIFVEPQNLGVNQYTVNVFGGDSIKLRVAVVSDLHMKSRDNPVFLDNVVKKLNDADADYNVITGDLIDGYREEIPLLEPLKNIRDRNHTIIVLGNHDYGHGWDDKSIADNLTAWLQDNGFRVLRNQRLRDGGACFVGLDDPWARQTDLDKAYEGVEPDCAVIVLAHNPDLVFELENRRVDLMLAGHTHGGQVCLPLIEPIWIPSRIRENCGRGFYSLGGTRLFITKGVVGGIRFNAAPEIAVIEIV
jgi:hypothetical protein